MPSVTYFPGRWAVRAPRHDVIVVMAEEPPIGKPNRAAFLFAAPENNCLPHAARFPIGGGFFDNFTAEQISRSPRHCPRRGQASTNVERQGESYRCESGRSPRNPPDARGPVACRGSYPRCAWFDTRTRDHPSAPLWRARTDL